MKTFLSTTTKKSRRNKGSRIKTVLIVGVVLILVLVVLQRPLGTVASYIGDPINKIEVWLQESPGVIPNYIRSKNSIIEERNQLAEEVRDQEGNAVRLTQLQLENEELRRFSENGKENVLATVLSRPNETPYDTLLIDRGSEHGVLKGALVYGGNNIAIGSVVETFPQSALVEMFTTPGVRLTAYVYGANTFARAEGMGGGVLRVGVPQGLLLEEGNIVILPSVGSGLFGRVEYVESDESDPEQYGYVPQLISIHSLHFVTVDTEIPQTVSYTDALSVIETASSTFFVEDIPESVLPDEIASTTTEGIEN